MPTDRHFIIIISVFITQNLQKSNPEEKVTAYMRDKGARDLSLIPAAV